MTINDWFDRYSLQARLAPALLSVFPVILLVAMEFPQVYETTTALVGLALTCGVLTLVSHLAREKGKKVEQRLNIKWGGKPTTRFFLDKNSELDAQTRQRYTSYFAKNIHGWSLGTNSNADIESAVSWLLGKTRDTTTYGLIFNENIAYGFRRNCLGMKPIGIIINLFCMVYWSEQIYSRLSGVSELNSSFVIGFGTTILLLLWWFFVVGDNWVKDAGDSYAKALLGSIDTMG